MAINQTKQNINIKSAPQMQKLQIWGYFSATTTGKSIWYLHRSFKEQNYIGSFFSILHCKLQYKCFPYTDYTRWVDK